MKYLAVTTINVTKSGYTPICVVGHGVTNGDNGNYYQWCTAYKGYLSSTSLAVIYIRHFATLVTVSVKPYVDVIWRKKLKNISKLFHRRMIK